MGSSVSLSRPTASRSRASTSAGPGAVEQHVVDAPLGRETSEAALGEDGHQRDGHAGGRSTRQSDLRHGQLAAGVHEHDVGGRGVDEGGGLGGQDAHLVAEQTQRWQHLGAGRQGVGQQQQVGHTKAG